MKRSTLFFPIFLAVAAVLVAVYPRPSAASTPLRTPATTGKTVVNVPGFVMTGKLELASGQTASGVTAIIAGLIVADSQVKNGSYRINLPNRLLASQLSSLENMRLVDGYGTLRGKGAAGAEVVLTAYQDGNGNGRFNAGEPKMILSPFPADKSSSYRAFFRYQVVVLSTTASLDETQDAPSGAKGFYRYHLANVPAGYSVLEGELADNGYDIRLRPGGEFTLMPQMMAGSKTAPAFSN